MLPTQLLLLLLLLPLAHAVAQLPLRCSTANEQEVVIKGNCVYLEDCS
jgi:hypothetical protein